MTAVLLSTTVLASDRNAGRSRRAIDQVGSWLLKRFPSEEADSPHHLQSDERLALGNRLYRLGTEEDQGLEKRYMDSVGSYLLKKKDPMTKQIRSVDPVGSYLIKRDE